MLYVFIDESGDLGFTKKSTKYYVIASVETRNLLGLARVIKKVRKTLDKKKKNIPEFKFARSDDYTRKTPEKSSSGGLAFLCNCSSKTNGLRLFTG